MATKRKILCSCLLVLLFCSGAPSDDKALDKNAEFAAGAIKSLAAAFNARDPNAIAELFTPTGEFVDGDGNVFQGRKAIAAEFTALFENNPRNAVELTTDEVREISLGVLVVESAAVFPAADDSQPVSIDFVAIVVKQADGRWLLASVRSEGDRNDPTPHTRLRPLEWLIGDWLDESDVSTMHTSNRWSDDGNFILGEFAIRVAGRKVMTGTQRIGWDGSLEKFKSWVFDSEGGHAEGIWTQIDDRWIVKSTGVRPDGAAGSATQLYQQNGPDGFLFSIIDRIVGDDSQPDFTAHVVRKPPEPDTASDAAAKPRGE